MDAYVERWQSGCMYVERRQGGWICMMYCCLLHTHSTRDAKEGTRCVARRCVNIDVQVVVCGGNKSEY